MVLTAQSQMDKKMALLRSMKGNGHGNSKVYHKDHPKIQIKKINAVSKKHNTTAHSMHVQEANKHHYPANINTFMDLYLKKK